MISWRQHVLATHKDNRKNEGMEHHEAPVHSVSRVTEQSGEEGDGKW